MSQKQTPPLDDNAVVSKKDLMEKLQYPADREFEKMIDDYLSREAIWDHHQTRSGLVLCVRDIDTIADVSRKILFGYESFKFMQKEAIESDTITKSSAFRLNTDANPEEALADLKEKNRKVTTYGDKSVHIKEINEQDGAIEVNLEYTIERRGKLQGLSRYRKSTAFTIENFQSEEDSTVYHEYDKVNQETAIKDFIEGWNEDRKDEDKEIIEREPITLSNLSLSSRVEFVRDLMSMETENWTRRNVEGVQVERDETVGGEDEKEDLDAELEGIRNAALSGKRLDTNKFVQRCEDNGFYLSMVEIRYEHKDIAHRAVVKIDFKEGRRETFEVSVTETLEQKESGWVSTEFSFEEMENIREEFRSIVMDKYNDYYTDDDSMELD